MFRGRDRVRTKCFVPGSTKYVGPGAWQNHGDHVFIFTSEL